MALALKSLILLALLLGGFWAYVLHRAQAHETRAEAAFPPRGQFLQVNGHRVHAVVMGSGPDLVLLHGSGGNSRDLTLQLAPRLAADYRVIILDRPGHGYTDRINSTGATISQQANLLQRAAAQLGAEKPIVWGHSFGGAVALAWAVEHPENIAALVPLSTPSHPWTTGISTYYKVLSHPVLGPIVIPLITAFVDDTRVTREPAAVFHPDPVPPGFADHFGPGLTLRRNALRANALQRANLLDQITALQPRYPGVNVPTEIVHGTADRTVSLHIHSEPLAQTIPDANLTPLDGIGHMPQHAVPDQVIAAIHRAAFRAGLRPTP